MKVTAAIRTIFRSFSDFFKDGGIMLAGSLSYFAVMAIVPFCLFLITIFGNFLGRDVGFYQFFLSKLTSFFPKITHEVTEELRRIIVYKNLGNLTIILYGLLSYQFFSSLESVLNTIFKTKAKRHFFVSVIISLCMITLVIAFLLISFVATSLIPMLNLLREFFPDLRISSVTRFLIRFVVPLILVFLTVMSLYYLLPKRKIRFSHAAAGAFFTALFLEAAKHAFTLYVGNIMKLGTIYGPLTAFVLFMLWVFYSSCIFLIGAELVHNLGGVKEGQK